MASENAGLRQELSLRLGLYLGLVLWGGWRRAADGGQRGGDLRGRGGVLLRGRLRLVLHVLLQLLLLHLLQLHVLELLLQLLLAELLLQVLLHVVLEVLLLHLLLDLLMHLVLVELLLLHLLLHVLLLELQLVLLLLALQGRAGLGGHRGRRAHHAGPHGAYQRRGNVCGQVGRDRDRRNDLVHGQPHRQRLGRDGPGEGLLESLWGRSHGGVLGKRAVHQKGGRQVCGGQRLLNGTDGLGFGRLSSSLWRGIQERCVS